VLRDVLKEALIQSHDKLKSLLQKSHSPQASAWGYSSAWFSGTVLTVYEVEPVKLHAKVSFAFGFIRRPGKPLKRFLSNRGASHPKLSLGRMRATP